MALDSGMVSPPHFDHEKLDVYQLELKFLSWVTQFLADLSSRSPGARELREQLDRASLSALLNTAEGNGRRQGRQRAKFFDDARGSPGHRVFVIFASFCADPLSSKGRKILAHKIPKFSKGFRTEFSGNRTLLRRCEK